MFRFRLKLDCELFSASHDSDQTLLAACFRFPPVLGETIDLVHFEEGGRTYPGQCV